VFRNLRRPEVRTPRRRWNPEKCVPLLVLGYILAVLAMTPILMYVAKGVLK
jgi:hypothetical protein